MTTKIDIISGVLGAGKTTLINRILDDVMKTDKVALVENEFGEIGVDGHRLAESGVALREISGGCICCTLFGNFVSAAKKLISQIRPDRMIVEPTGVGKLTDVLKAVEAVGKVESISINMVVTVVDPLRYDLYTKMFGDFFKDQVQMAKTIFLSRTQLAEEESIEHTVSLLRDHNRNADIITRPWLDLTGAEIVAMGEKKNTSVGNVVIAHLEKNTHHLHEDNEIEVWSIPTSARYSKKQFKKVFNTLENEKEYGMVVRGKGFFQTPEGDWLQYDYVPGETTFCKAGPIHTGKIVFIGKQLNRMVLQELLDSFADN